MPSKTPSRHYRRRRLALGATILLATVGGLAVVGTQALFTSSETAPANTFTSGTLDIAATPSSTAMTVTNMAPGDVVVAPVSLRNDGSLPMVYSASSTASGNLAQYLELTIKTNVTTCSAAGFAASGQAAYGAGNVGAPAGQALFGNSAQGLHVGDRPLAASTSETLCVQVALPLARGNEVAGQVAAMTLTFNAEQAADLVTNLAYDPGFEKGRYATVAGHNGTGRALGLKRNTSQGDDYTSLTVAALAPGCRYTLSFDAWSTAPVTTYGFFGLQERTGAWRGVMNFGNLSMTTTPKRFSMSGVAPADISPTAAITVRPPAPGNVTDTIFYDNLMLTCNADLTDFRSGDSPGWVWSGEATSATSTGPKSN